MFAFERCKSIAEHQLASVFGEVYRLAIENFNDATVTSAGLFFLELHSQPKLAQYLRIDLKAIGRIASHEIVAAPLSR
jgi:hypothetical protein